MREGITAPDEVQKEKYSYENYLSQLEGARLHVMPKKPGIEYVRAYDPKQNSPYTMTQAMAEAFMQNTLKPPNSADSDDFFQQKKELSEDKIGLILSEINLRDRLKYDNLGRLYDDLLRIDNWRLTPPFPQNYATDKTWTDLNKMELQIRDQIRRELKDAAKDTAFPAKDLREGLLEFKLQDQKSQMMMDMNQMDIGGLENEIGPDGPQKQTGDLNYRQPY